MSAVGSIDILGDSQQIGHIVAGRVSVQDRIAQPLIPGVYAEYS
jgi:hypothetical protein